jgi:hypothetical protein
VRLTTTLTEDPDADGMPLPSEHLAAVARAIGREVQRLAERVAVESMNTGENGPTLNDLAEQLGRRDELRRIAFIYDKAARTLGGSDRDDVDDISTMPSPMSATEPGVE